MEQLILDIETYCAARGIKPQRLLREVINAKWGQWQDWKDGKASPTMRVVDRLRAYIADTGEQHTKAVGEDSPPLQESTQNSSVEPQKRSAA